MLNAVADEKAGLKITERTRITNLYGTKTEGLVAAVSLHLNCHNFAGPHESLSNPSQRISAMAAGVATQAWGHTP
jgi:hypothetical protein